MRNLVLALLLVCTPLLAQTRPTTQQTLIPIQAVEPFLSQSGESGSVLLVTAKGSVAMYTGGREASRVALAQDLESKDIYGVALKLLAGTEFTSVSIVKEGDRWAGVVTLGAGANSKTLRMRPSDAANLAVRSKARFAIAEEIVRANAMKAISGEPISPEMAIEVMHHTKIVDGARLEALNTHTRLHYFKYTPSLCTGVEIEDRIGEVRLILKSPEVTRQLRLNYQEALAIERVLGSSDDSPPTGIAVARLLKACGVKILSVVLADDEARISVGDSKPPVSIEKIDGLCLGFAAGAPVDLKAK